MLSRIITSTTAAAVAATVPANTALDPILAVDEAFDWYVINTGSNAFTVTGITGHTVVGSAVAGGSSGHFRTRKTAPATFVTYRH